MAAHRPSVFLFEVLKAIPSFAKTHFLAWFNPRALSSANRESSNRGSAKQIEPMPGLRFLIANLVVLSALEMIVLGHTPAFELPPTFLPLSKFLDPLPLSTFATFALATALWMLVPYCFLKLAGRSVTVSTLFRVLCYGSALVTGATVVIFYLPLLLLPREEFANLQPHLVWPLIAIGLFSYYWTARQLKFEGSNGGFAIYLGVFAATGLLSALQATPVWPIETYNNAAGSMLPTLRAGENVVANKWAYLWRPPKRGEIGAFRGPTDPHNIYLKRVIGIPGDTVQFIRGILHINGVPTERIRLPDFVMHPNTQAERRVRQYRESLPSTEQGGTNTLIRPMHRILKIYEGNGPLDNTPVYSVPDGHYFVLGDNRDNSLDSRVMNSIGFVSESHFLAPIYRRLLPPTNLDIPISIE
ncbi:signal peptidase I [Hwanghaeella grinnelliae]|uniref:signal peptidase I n=1 Tax=Hwanghaeella grinnelliae TaxID=2500179 RepID=UPI0013866A66|nr:signal peptidase I [Hwanghaeella grinnelliae]